MVKGPSAPRPLGAVFIARVRILREARGWTSLQLSERLCEVGYQMSHAMVRNQESRGASATVSIDQAVAVASVFGVPVEKLLRAPECLVCDDVPAPQTRCLACGAENRG